MQYLIKPVKIFREVDGILQPGGPAIVVFSSRMLCGKSCLYMAHGFDEGPVKLVERYFQLAGGFGDPALPLWDAIGGALSREVMVTKGQ